MGILGMINGLNGGRGLRCLTDEGLAALHAEIGAEMRRRGVRSYRAARESDWGRAIEARYYRPEHEGRFWAYSQAQAVR
jgi:hypothetical protein